MSSEFFVSRGDTAELFEPVEEAFHPITRLVAMTIIISRRVAIGARRNDRCGLLTFDARDQCIGVIALVGDHGPGPGAWSSKANAWVMSACSAPVSVKPMGLPSASTMPWIWVPNPPRERPRA